MKVIEIEPHTRSFYLLDIREKGSDQIKKRYLALRLSDITDILLEQYKQGYNIGNIAIFKFNEIQIPATNEYTYKLERIEWQIEWDKISSKILDKLIDNNQEIDVE